MMLLKSIRNINKNSWNYELFQTLITNLLFAILEYRMYIINISYNSPYIQINNIVYK